MSSFGVVVTPCAGGLQAVTGYSGAMTAPAQRRAALEPRCSCPENPLRFPLFRFPSPPSSHFLVWSLSLLFPLPFHPSTPNRPQPPSPNQNVASPASFLSLSFLSWANTFNLLVFGFYFFFLPVSYRPRLALLPRPPLLCVRCCLRTPRIPVLPRRQRRKRTHETSSLASRPRFVVACHLVLLSSPPTIACG